MEFVKKLETTLLGVDKDLPHLPKGLTKFLADWAWLFVLIGVVLSVLGMVSAILGLLALQATVGTATMYGGMYGANYAAAASGSPWLSLGVSAAFTLVVVAINVNAITPLRVLNKKGWDLIFLSYLVNIAAGIVGAFLTMNIFGLVFSAIFWAIGFYILIEVRSYFAVPAANHKKPEVLKAKK